MFVFLFMQRTTYETRSRYWSSDVCSSDLLSRSRRPELRRRPDAADRRLIPPNNRNQYRGPSAGPRKGEAMSISITNTAARLQRDVPATEGRNEDRKRVV